MIYTFSTWLLFFTFIVFWDGSGRPAMYLCAREDGSTEVL